MNIKICIDCRFINASGIGIYLQNLIPYLLEIYEILLIGSNKELTRLKWTKDCKIIHLDNHIYSMKEQFELPLKVPDSDLFWSPHYNIPLLPIRAKKRLVTIHDVFHLAFLDQLSFKQKVYAKLMINLAVRLSDKIVTVSNFSKSEIIKFTNISENKIEVIYNGINKNSFKIIHDNSLVEGVRTKYDLPKRFILYVGNVKPHKNLIRLLKAFKINLIQNGIKDYNLVIVGKKEGFITGDKGLFKMLEDNTNLKRKVLFTGYVENEDLPVIYNLASLFVFPSFYEGFGLPPLEAMACGCPVVVSNAASLPEVCGDAAYYIDPHDVESIAKGMCEVLTDDDLMRILIRKGLERVNIFSWERSAREHLRVFEEGLSS